MADTAKFEAASIASYYQAINNGASAIVGADPSMTKPWIKNVYPPMSKDWREGILAGRAKDFDVLWMDIDLDQRYPSWIVCSL